ncbi:MAG: 2OG-Fe(II) oxygenase [Nitrospinales bacterium]
MTDRSATAQSAAVQSALAAAIEALDRRKLKADFQAQNEFLAIDNFLPPPALDAIRADLPSLLARIHRNYVPTYKKGGSVGRHAIDRLSPAIGQVYAHPALVEFLGDLAGEPLQDCPADDPHTYALYCYTEPGDHIGFHYDTSYYRGKRYTVLVGLVDDSSCRLVCELYRDDPARQTQTLSLALKPGALVVFNGDNLYHKVTPLGPGETRIALTMEYVTDRGMNPVARLVSNIKDAVGYFGWRGVFAPGKAARRK